MRKELIFLVFILSAMLLWGNTESWSEEKKEGSPRNGKLLYDKLKCSYCHKIGSEGGSVGPDLTKGGAKNRGVEWQIKNLIDPASTHAKHPDMPKFDKLTDKMLLDLASYLESLK
jgi:mono/diheme cytochrome c family protein